MLGSEERRFLDVMASGLATLPFDLKVLFEAKDDPDLDRPVREVACGAIVYVLSGAEVASERSIAGFADDVILVRLALQAVAREGGEGAGAFRDRFQDQYEHLDEQINTIEHALGADLFSWMTAKIATLPKLLLRSKKVSAYIDDEQAVEDLYERGLTFQTNYELTETVLADKFKQVRPVLEHLQRKRNEEAKKIG